MESKVILASKPAGQKLNVFKLHKDDDITWSDAKMKRENDFQPWQIKLGTGRAARRFKAVKEGGVGENASYFIFYKPKNSTDNTYEVSPVDEWYNVSATQRYKTLTAEEAEQKFEQRHKTLNYFSVMHSKKNADSGEEKSSTFKLTEMDEWDNSGDDFSGSDKEGDEEDGAKKRKKVVKKDEGDDAPQEGKEDSDEGDFEQREVDYMSDTSSESDQSSTGDRDKTDVKGIAEEEALRDLLSTDDEEDDGGSQTKGAGPLGKGPITTTDLEKGPEEGYEDSSDSDDYDVDDEKMDSLFKNKSLPANLLKQPTSDNDIAPNPSIPTSATTNVKKDTMQSSAVANKRKLDVSQASTSAISQPPTSPPKRPCQAESSSSAPINSHEKVVEDLIKKYLSRKPMTLKALLKDVKSKLKRMGGATAEMDGNLINMIAAIMNRIKLDRQKINDTTYFSIKH